MIRVNDDYVIQVDNLNYTAMRDAHRKTTRTDKNGATVEVDAYVTIGYFKNLSGAIKGIIADMNARKLSDGVHTLKEALEIVTHNNDRFYELLESIEEVGENDKT